MPKVNFVRTEVTALTPRWTIVRDCLSGSKAVKDKGTAYLPQPNATDQSTANVTRYDQYKQRAVFYNVTARTLKGLTGQVFARDPVVQLPALLEIMEEDVDGGGVSLDQQARKALSHVIAHGRCGILTDYPKVEGPVTKAMQDDGTIRPNICLYDPWDIINWRVTTIGGKKIYSLIVLSESEVVDDDGFETTRDDYYRVLRLYEGAYWSEVWYFDTTLNDFVLDERIQPLDSAGKPWNRIPFTFIGAENNDSVPDLPPLYDLAEINIAHYRNSADYEESCFIVGQPTPVLAGLTESWVKDVLKGEVQLGSRAAIPLPEGGSASLLQAAPNSMPKEGMEHKELQMVALGAKLVEQKTVQRTATEAGLDSASETSLLATAAKNVSHAYTAALKWAALFVGASEDLSYDLNTDFDISRLPAAEQAQIIADWQSNAISFTEMRDNLKRGGIAYQDDEEAKAEMDSDGVSLNVPVGSPASAAADAAKAKAEADAAKAKDKINNPPPVSK